MLTLLAKLLNALNSESSTRQIAMAIALALIFGLSPFWSLHNLAILFVVLLVKVNLATFIVAAGLFKGLGFILSSLMISIGESLLMAPSLNGFFTLMYQFDWFKLAHWHNTLTLGSFVLGVILAIPAYFVSKVLVEKYRSHFKRFIEQLRIVKAIKASKFFSIYQQFSGQGA